MGGGGGGLGLNNRIDLSYLDLHFENLKKETRSLMINFDSRDKIEFIKVILSPIFKKWGKRQDVFWSILTLETR